MKNNDDAKIELTFNSTMMRGTLANIMTLTSRLLMNVADTLTSEAGIPFEDGMARLIEVAHDMKKDGLGKEQISAGISSKEKLSKEIIEKMEDLKKRADNAEGIVELLDILDEVVKEGKAYEAKRSGGES